MTRPNDSGVRRVVLLLAVVFLSAFLCSFRLGIPPGGVFDEVYYVPAARSLLAGKPDPNWVHPPLAKLIIAGSIAIFGDNAFAWRLPSVAAAVLAQVFFFLLVLELFKSDSTAFLACILYLLDGMTLVQARIAMLDMPMVGFLIPSLYFFRKKQYLTSSIFLGLSLSCKWGALLVFPLYFVFLPFPSGFRKWGEALVDLLAPCFAVYSLVFVLSSAGLGHVMGHPLQRHLQMINFHLRPTMSHPYKAEWWKWILLIRPIWYSYHQTGKIARGIVALPNPFFWWPALAAALLLVFRWYDETACFILGGVFFFTVPWMVSVKGGFMYYLLPASPFLALAATYWVSKNRGLAWSAVAFALIGFALFFPLYTYLPISTTYFNRMMWLGSWT